MRSSSLYFALAFSCGATLACCPALQAAHASKPNILFIAVDDLRLELGCYGNTHIKSPNIDRLSHCGVTFNHAYTQQAVCNPSRVSLLTGLRPDTTRVWDLITNVRTNMPDVVTLPQHFKQNGYYAVGMGKIFHNTFPDPPSWTIPQQPAPKPGFSEYRLSIEKEVQEKRDEARKAGKSQNEIIRLRGPATEDEDVPDDKRFDGALTETALVQLRKAHEQPLPFFFAVGFIRPHLPFTAPKKYWDLYDPATIPLAVNPFLPKDSPAVAFGDVSFGGMYELRDYTDFRKSPTPFQGSLTEAEQRRLKHGYYAAVSFTDAMIGRVLDEFDKLGKRDNTIIVLWGDHGWKLGEHNGWCKQTNYEIDTNVPLIIVDPRAKANGKSSDALVEFLDLYPTLCELAGIPAREGIEGKSIAALLDDPTKSIKPAAFSQFPRVHKGEKYMGYAMRTNRYRYVEWLKRESVEVAARELYDEKSDPMENQNIANDAANAKVVQQLSGQLWASLKKPGPYIEPTAKKKASASAPDPGDLASGIPVPADAQGFAVGQDLEEDAEVGPDSELARQLAGVAK